MTQTLLGTTTATVTIRARHRADGTVAIEAECTDPQGSGLCSGTLAVFGGITRSPPATPERAEANGRFQDYLDAARDGPPLRVAVVHPCNAESISAAIEAAAAGLLEPVLVGPERKIRAAAEQAGMRLDGIAIETTDHSHAAAARAVELAVAGHVNGLMKGSLHTDELLGAVIAPASSLRTQRRISHVYVLDVPAYPKPLIVTDAAINIAPTLAQKRDIVQNAVDFLHALGIPEPTVAILAAVETVNPAMPATIDAAALTVMTTRGQIRGAKVDGPLAFDNAINPDAARIKDISSAVAGHPDILVAPDLEAGNMLAKQLIYLAGAGAAGLVLGARVPIILTSRADSLKVRLASVALAKLFAARMLPGTFIG